MFETSNQPPGQRPNPNTPGRVLINLVITLLAPFFLAAADGDIGFARSAAAETIESDRRQTNADLITIALIIAFGLTALASLCQSTQDDLSPALALRLRSNASACNRAAEHNRRALKEYRPGPGPGTPPPTPPEPDPVTLIGQLTETSKRAADHLATYASPAQDTRHHQAAWAASAARVAAQSIADFDNMSPEQRRKATVWAETLNACAKDLMSCEPAPRLRPGDIAGFMHPGAA
jgi:hypothetical protein